MNDEMTTMYHGNNGLGNSSTAFMQNQMERSGPRQYPLDVLQYMGNVNISRNFTYGPTDQSLPRRPPPRKDRQQKHVNDGTAFGYDSDDSSLSSNASSSAKSNEKGDAAFRSSDMNNVNSLEGKGVREWRGRPRRELRPRRIAPDRYLHAAYGYQVKFAPDDLLNGSKWDTLSQEMWDKFVTSQQTEDTFRKKMLVWRYLYITVKTVYPRYGLYVVGSTMSGFGLDSSDMDLCLFVRSTEDIDSRTSAIIHLGYILNYVRNVDSSVELIQAKVPILKFVDSRHGVQVDLNCNNLVGIRNTNLLYHYSRLDWRVRPLVVITKLWARAHNINDARQRTLSSYSLTLMVIHFLQYGTSPAVLPCMCVRAAWWEYAGGAAAARWPAAQRSPNRQSLGELFAVLLHYYANFPYDKMAVSVRAGRPVPVVECRAARSFKNDPQQWKYICVEDSNIGEEFRNRKGYYSLNVQCVCDTNLLFMNVVARWPGSTHDATIFNNTELREPFDLTNTARSVYDPESFERIVNAFRESHQRLATGLRLADAWPR